MPATASAQGTSDGVAVVERAVLLQQLVAAAEKPLSLRELARRAGLPTSTAARLTRTLQGLSLIERDVRGRLVVGPGAETLTGSSPGDQAHVHLLDIVLRRVVERFGESATAGIDTGSEVLYLGCRAAGGDISVSDVTGQSSPHHLIASGVVLMAEWPEDRLRDYLRRDLVAATPSSVTDSTTLRRRVEQAREQGYAWSVGEAVIDITALAVPVRNQRGATIAAIGLYGPSFRLSSDVVDPHDLIDLVEASTRALNVS